MLSPEYTAANLESEETCSCCIVLLDPYGDETFRFVLQRSVVRGRTCWMAEETASDRREGETRHRLGDACTEMLAVSDEQPSWSE